MKNRISQAVLSIVAMTLLCAPGLASLAYAASDNAPVPALDGRELDAVIQEIKTMIKTDESRVVDFVVRAATPERIEALYAMPETAHLPKDIRENGLIFAGRGSRLLSFDRPSEVIAKLASWFPDELARARAARNPRLWAGDVHLWGPFENWEAEPAAFLALWNCMPQSAWLKPDQNPFQRRLNDGLPLYPVAARQSSYEEFDFAFCVRERNGYRSARTMEEAQVNQARVRAMAGRITPLLENKFTRFLGAHRCAGKGPDDCVLVLRLWASLLPASAELAAMLQSLEPDVAPDGPLPELHNPGAAWSESAVLDGQDRFDQGLRRAAFLRAKLLSVMSATQAWPADALATTLHQMTALRQTFAIAYVHRWYQYELDYRNDPINPWRVFAPKADPSLTTQLALLDELDRIDDSADCEVYEQWFKHGGKSLQTIHVVRRLADRLPVRCAAPDWEWLRQDGNDEARYTRYRYLALLGHVSVSDQDLLVSGLTQGRARCADKPAAQPDWLQALCRNWVSRSQRARPRRATRDVDSR